MPEPIKIDVWSDVACPWCYIGKRKLELGIAAFAQRPDAAPVEVEYHSFELMPDVPPGFAGTTVDLLVTHHGLAPAQVGSMHQQVTRIAAEVGLAYDFASQQPTNTLKAHQVLHLAKVRGRQGEANERLFRAHFVEGRHVGRDEDLATLAGDVGLDPDEVEQALREQTYLPAVRADIQRARELGISGVPFFVIDGRYGISGAQSPQTFTQALTTVHTERSATAASG